MFTCIYQFIVKDMDEQPDEEVHGACRKGVKFPCPSWAPCLSSNLQVLAYQPGSSPNPVLCGVMEALLHRHD